MPVTPAGRAATVVQRHALADARARLIAPLIAEILEGGATSFPEIAKKLNERGGKTDRGGAWTRTKVRRLMLRLEGL